MSRLIFEGDTISRFGNKIPTPFIEKLKIYQDYIVPTISIYLHITEDDTINEEIYNDLSNLYLHSGFGRITNAEKLSLGNTFSLVSDQIYNSQSKRFAKFSYSPEQEYETANVRGTTVSALTRAITRVYKRETYYSCFISVLEDEGGEQNSSLFVTHNSSDEIDNIEQGGDYRRYSNVSSPLVYEKVFTAPLNGVGNNRLANDPINLYEDLTGLPYESIPLQSIQKDYYKTTDLFREDIKKQIDDLVASYGEVEDQQLQSFLDSISYVSETQNRSIEFIVELDKVRNSFPSRTSTSALGILYNRLKTIIFSANDTLILGERLQKKIVPNMKIVDLRGDFLEQEWQRRNEISYEPRVDDSGAILYNKVLMERQELENSELLKEPDFNVTSIFGYFFLDYEKALHGKSNISQIYEVQKLLNIFGNNALDLFFPIAKTEISKFQSATRIRKNETIYRNNRQIRSNLIFSATGQNKVRKVVLRGPFNSPNTTVPYTLLRGFDLIESLGDYRLLAFEFQDFESSLDSIAQGQSYRFSVYLDDNTLDFYDLLVAQFEEAKRDIEEYLSYANEFCSYNNIDNRFNDFFVKAMEEQFGSQFPWIEAARVFSIHLDLINDTYLGVKEAIANNAENQASLISPRNGTLEELQNFVQKMNNFYEKYYGARGEVTIQITSRRTPDGTFTTSLRDNTQFVATLGFDELPNVVDFTVENFETNAEEDDKPSSGGGFAGNDREADIVEGPGLRITTEFDTTAPGTVRTGGTGTAGNNQGGTTATGTNNSVDISVGGEGL
jgi:hypothetical protein